MFEKIKTRCRKDCENCILGWENCSYEGECDDCGCMLYGDLDAGRLACYLPNTLLRPVRDHIEKRNDRFEAKQYDGITEWFAAEEQRDRLFRSAIREQLLSDSMGHPVQPLYKTQGGKYMTLDLDCSDYDGYRIDFEANQAQGMAPAEALKTAFGDLLSMDLYYRSGSGQYCLLDLAANCFKTCQAYETAIAGAGVA